MTCLSAQLLKTRSAALAAHEFHPADRSRWTRWLSARRPRSRLCRADVGLISSCGSRPTPPPCAPSPPARQAKLAQYVAQGGGGGTSTQQAARRVLALATQDQSTDNASPSLDLSVELIGSASAVGSTAPLLAARFTSASDVACVDGWRDGDPALASHA